MADISDQIVDATLSLLADRPFADVTVIAIARQAGISLAELNQHFATRIAILDAFARRIDRQVLAADTTDMADESPRDRLFDVLMTRLDALRPHRAALSSLMRSARRDPQLALALNRIALRSQTWMLAASGLSMSGLRGRLAVQSLAAAFAKVLRVFLGEDDPGLPRTMAALDQALKALEERHERLARFFGPALSPEPAAAADAGSNSPAAAPEPAAAAEPEPGLAREAATPSPKAAGAVRAKQASAKPASPKTARATVARPTGSKPRKRATKADEPDNEKPDKP